MDGVCGVRFCKTSVRVCEFEKGVSPLNPRVTSRARTTKRVKGAWRRHLSWGCIGGVRHQRSACSVPGGAQLWRWGWGALDYVLTSTVKSQCMSQWWRRLLLARETPCMAIAFPL